MTFYRDLRRESHVLFELRTFDGTRESIADLLQDRDAVPNGMRPGQVAVRQREHARVRVTTPDIVTRFFRVANVDPDDLIP